MDRAYAHGVGAANQWPRQTEEWAVDIAVASGDIASADRAAFLTGHRAERSAQREHTDRCVAYREAHARSLAAQHRGGGVMAHATTEARAQLYLRWLARLASAWLSYTPMRPLSDDLAYYAEYGHGRYLRDGRWHVRYRAR